MTTEKFTASTQYTDWKGEIAVDNHTGTSNIGKLLVDRGLIEENDVLYGISLYTEFLGDPQVYAYIYKDNNNRKRYDMIKTEEPIPLLKINLDIPLDDLLRQLKRLDICISYKGNLSGKDIIIED